MKIALTSGYSFTASTKTLDLSSYSGFDIKRLVAVVNLKRNAIIYAPGVTGYSSITGGNVLVLSYDTTGHADADPLMVLYEAVDGDLTNGLDVDVTRLPALVAGSAVVGQVGIDQTTAGTTDSVTVKASAGIGSLTETAPASDTASSGLNGRLQRIAQRLSTLITALGSPFQAGGSIGNTSFGATQSGTWTVQPGNTANTTAWKVDGSAVTQPVSGTFYQATQPISAVSLPLPSGAATSAKQDSVIALLPAALGQGTKAQGLRITPPSDYQAPILAYTAAPTVTSVTANNSDMVASMDVTPYRAGSLYVSGFGSATVSIQISNDNTNWTSLQVHNVGGALPSVTSTGQYFFNIPAALYLRVRTTAYSSGTIAGALALSSLPYSPEAVSLTGGTTVAIVGAINSDATTFGQALNIGGPLYYNNSAGSYDRAKNVHALSLLTSSARTSTTDSTDQTNYNWRGCILIVNVTSAGTGSITPSIQVKDSISSTYKTVWSATTPLTSNGMYAYALYPNSVAASFTEAASIMLSRTWRLEMVANNANSVTYSASADMQL